MRSKKWWLVWLSWASAFYITVYYILGFVLTGADFISLFGSLGIFFMLQRLACFLPALGIISGLLASLLSKEDKELSLNGRSSALANIILCVVYFVTLVVIMTLHGD
jgi:hypothetical protein